MTKKTTGTTRTLPVDPKGGGKNWIRFTDPASGQSLLMKRADVPEGADRVNVTLAFEGGQ